MARLRTNVIAGYAGHAWVALMGLAFVPLYLRELGAESFGLVAFMLSLQAMTLLFDLGMSVHISREVARRSIEDKLAGTIRRLVRSFEFLVWPVAVALGLAVFLASSLIASEWLQPVSLSHEVVVSSLWLTAAVIVAAWPGGFYAAGLVGLEQQPRLNALVVVFTTIRFAGVVPLLWYTPLGITGFLAWHALVVFLQTVATAWLCWRHLPPAAGATAFDWSEIRNGGKFALAAFTVIALGLVFSQLDKLAVSHLLPLGELGVYSVAAAISAGMGRLVMPVFSATYPRFGRLIAQHDRQRTIELFQVTGQLVAVIVGPVAFVLCAYSEELLMLWTGDGLLARRLTLVMALLVAGAGLNALISVPFSLQLAGGDTRPALIVNAALVVLTVPAYALATSDFGLEGAAGVWLVANALALVGMLALMRSQLPPGQVSRWAVRAIVLPLACAAGAVYLGKWFADTYLPLVSAPLVIVCISALALVAAVSGAPQVRMALRFLLLDSTSARRTHQ